MNKLALTSALVLGGVGGFALSQWLVASERAQMFAVLDEHKAATPEHAFSAQTRCEAVITDAQLERLRLALSEQAQTVQSAKVAVAAGEPARAGTPLDEQAEAALLDAQELVARAEASGQWSDRDVLELRSLLAQLGAEDAASTLTMLTTAINAQRIKPTVRGPLW